MQDRVAGACEREDWITSPCPTVATRGHAKALPLHFERVGVAVGDRPILRGVDLVVGSGGPTLIVGPNGAGKTTLLKLAAALMAPTSGRLTFAGEPTPPAGSRAMVLQRPVMLRRSVAGNVAFALRAAGRSPAPAQIARLLTLARLDGLDGRSARTLSGGEQQRLALARALARDPQLLLLDEPTASLDPAATLQIERLVRGLAAAGVKVVMTTHDLGQARRLADEIVLMAGGRVVEQGPARAVFEAPRTDVARRFLAGEIIAD